MSDRKLNSLMPDFQTAPHQYALGLSSLSRITNFKESFFQLQGPQLFLEAFTLENVEFVNSGLSL